MKEFANRLKSIIETAIDGIITIDSSGLIEDINNSALVLFGYKKEEVVGVNIKMLMPHQYSQHHDEYISSYITTRKPKIIGIGREVKGKRKNGEIFPFRLAVSEVVLHNRIIFTGIIHDLSDLKKSQEDLHRLNKELEEKVERRTREIEQVVNKLLKTNAKLEESESFLTKALEKERELSSLKSRFVSMASHEFRTPLTTILSSASLIGKYEMTEEQDKRERHIAKIKSAVGNLTGILNDFLSLSKIEEGKITTSKNTFDLITLAHSVKEDLAPIIKNKVQLAFEIPSSLSLYSDKNIVKNVLFNLLSNAIKYSKEGGIVTLKIAPAADTVVIKVIDHGIGIPEADQAYLFERFHRASNVENIQGTGLGLHIVKRYIELLDGSISFESEEGIGTSFTVTLANHPID